MTPLYYDYWGKAGEENCHSVNSSRYLWAVGHAAFQAIENTLFSIPL